MWNKAVAITAGLAIVGSSAVALAFAPTLQNHDSRSYQVSIQCGGSTTRSSIGSSTRQTLSGRDGCTLTVEGAGSAQLRDDMRCEIRDGSLSCR